MGVSFKERYKISDTHMYMIAHDFEARFQVPHFHPLPHLVTTATANQSTTTATAPPPGCMAYLEAHNITSSQRETSGPACIHSIAVL